MSDDEPFASPADLEKRWRGLSSDETDRASVLLEDATDLIKAECPHWKTATAATLRRITCAVVKRAMQGDAVGDASAPGVWPDPRGTVASETHTTGPFSDTFTYANPDGTLFLRAAEVRLLGGRGRKAFEIDALAASIPRR